MAIFTVGYGGRKLHNLISLLKECNVDLVVDVRRFPKSGNPDYNQDNLERLIADAGMHYVFMGQELGGLRREGYIRHMQSELYQRGITKLLDIASGRNVVLMCKERNESDCHRRYLVETLRALGMETTPLDLTKQGRLL